MEPNGSGIGQLFCARIQLMKYLACYLGHHILKSKKSPAQIFLMLHSTSAWLQLVEFQ